MTAKIKLNAASGGGSFSLQAPSSSANTRVMTLPDTADGTILTTTNPKAGNIIQVVTSSQQTGASQSFSTDSFVNTGLSASITPSSSSNKILVTGYISWYINLGANASAEWNFAVCDGSNNILDSTSADAQGYRFNELYNQGGKHPINFLHSPNTTSSFAYVLKMNAKSSNATGTLVCQRNGTANNISRITLMEIAA